MTQGFIAPICSKAVVLRLENVDTDVITPIARVLEGRDAVVRFAFEPLRFHRDGTPRDDDPFADPARRGAQILLAGQNFGCGSSRETAAWAVKGMGFDVVMAEGFGDIFYSNCIKNGVLPVRLAADAMEALMGAAEKMAELQVDLTAQEVRLGARAYSFDIGDLQKAMLLEGLDEIGLINTRADAYAAFETRDRTLRPWVRQRQHADPNQ